LACVAPKLFLCPSYLVALPSEHAVVFADVEHSADDPGCLCVMDAVSGELLRKLVIRDEDGSPQEDVQPAGILADAEHLWIADISHHRVLKISRADGTIRAQAGARAGDGDGEPQYTPEGLAAHEGRLFISDHCQHRIVVLDQAFGQKGEADGEFTHPEGLVVVSEELVVCDTYSHPGVRLERRPI
jgi:hypothetical protein